MSTLTSLAAFVPLLLTTQAPPPRPNRPLTAVEEQVEYVDRLLKGGYQLAHSCARDRAEPRTLGAQSPATCALALSQLREVVLATSVYERTFVAHPIEAGAAWENLSARKPARFTDYHCAASALLAAFEGDRDTSVELRRRCQPLLSLVAAGDGTPANAVLFEILGPPVAILPGTGGGGPDLSTRASPPLSCRTLCVVGGGVGLAVAAAGLAFLAQSGSASGDRAAASAAGALTPELDDWYRDRITTQNDVGLGLAFAGLGIAGTAAALFFLTPFGDAPASVESL